jgi:hypothetical protein
MTFHNKLLAKKSFFHLPVPYQAVYLSFAANWVSGRGVRNFVLMGFPASHRVLPPREGWQRSPGIGGSFAVESAAAFTWNRWQACYGISGSFRVERVAALIGFQGLT